MKKIYLSSLFFFFICSVLMGQNNSTSANCEDLAFSAADNQITVMGLTTDFSQIQIIGQNTNWQVITICSGDCAENQVIPDLETGEYTVKVQLNSNDGSDCYREEKVTVESSPISNEICQIKILSSTFPSVVQPGQTVNFTATIKNTGTNTSLTTTIGLYQFFGGNKAPGPMPRLKGNASVASLAPNEEKVIDLTITLDDPLYNSFNDIENSPNNFALLMEEDAQVYSGWANCNFPIDFEIDFPKGDLALSWINDLGCIDANNVSNADLQLENVGNTMVEAPIYIGLGSCSFVNDGLREVKCFFPSAVAYWIIDQDIPVGGILTLSRPFKVPNSFIEEWGHGANIVEFTSNLADTNPDNNRVSKKFIRTETCNKAQGTVANCDNLTLTPSDNQIEVNNLTSTFSQIQIIGQNTDWQVVTVCSGDCAENQVIPNLEAGDYSVKIQLNGSDGSNCYREEKVTVSDDGGNNGTGVNCADLTFTTENGQIAVSGLTANSEKIEIIGQNTDWQIVEICNGDCAEEQIINDLEAGEYAVKVNQFGSDGSYCYREEKLTVGNDGGGSNSNGLADCAALAFSTPATEQILVEGLTAAYNKVEIIGYQTDWQVKTICDGDCEEDQTIIPLESGFVTVKVSQVGSDGQFCYREEELKVIKSGRTRSTNNLAKEITLFPNPVKSTLQLNMTRLNGKTGRIEVFNGYGQSLLLIPQKTFSSTIETIDVQTLPNGFYYLTIQAENTRLVTKRFVVESYK